MDDTLPHPNRLTRSVLYYPTIEFADEGWAKSALLFWDKIYRIVPASYTPNDSDEIRRAVDAGLIEQINLNKDDLAQTADDFEGFWDYVPFMPAALEKQRPDIRLHPDKVDERIRPILESLAKTVDPEGWLRLSPEIANAYMLFLSETISRRRQIPKLTDSSDMYAIMHYFTTDGNLDEWLTNHDANETTTSLVLQTILPADITQMPMDEVLRFRSTFNPYRDDFHNTVMTFTEQVAHIEDAQFLHEAAIKFQEELTVTREKLFNAVVASGKRALSAALSIGLPTTLTAIGALGLEGSDPFNFSRLGTAGFIGVVATIADLRRSRRKQWTSNESLYYMHLQAAATSAASTRMQIPDYSYILNEFIND